MSLLYYTQAKYTSKCQNVIERIIVMAFHSFLSEDKRVKDNLKHFTLHLCITTQL